MINPVSTYRVQLHRDFTFSHLERIIPYLHRLGIQTLYVSPVFTATPGSMHGYDGVNPNAINPDIGTMEQLASISKKIQELGMYWLQDIVPNHMAFNEHNHWLMDVLEKGQQSDYVSYFDIDWNNKVYEGKLMVPFLGASLEEVIAKGELRLIFREGRFYLTYYNNHYPLNFSSYITLLNSTDPLPADMVDVIDKINAITGFEDKKDFKNHWKNCVSSLHRVSLTEQGNSYITKRITEANRVKEVISSLALQQVYRMCYWKETNSHINYRRFFTINGLICLNMQHAHVVEDFHRLIRELIQDRMIHGLRIDHIDGLYDPTTYLNQLRSLAGKETYVVVEKILEQKEKLPNEWNIQGTTGYDFLYLVNNVFTNKNAEEVLTSLYNTISNNSNSVKEQVREKKAFILKEYMQGELENLYQQFLSLQLAEEKVMLNIGVEQFKQALAEFLIHCPVYRFYGNKFPLKKRERVVLEQLLHEIKSKKPELLAALNLLETLLLQKPMVAGDEHEKRAIAFFMRCMQFTGPLMAKGLEDTLMYTYNRFIAHNEVGGTPASFGISRKEFHDQMMERQMKWPLSMNATATHDTKRGEDVSARLNALSDLADEWTVQVRNWQEMNAGLKVNNMPDPNDEYFIYQTLIGTLPMPGQEDERYQERIQAYLTKALREGKSKSDWDAPNVEYEEAVKIFTSALLDKQGSFWNQLAPFHQKLSDFGIVNSLAKLMLKFTCPGVPDVYQGCEMWDLSFVDPDNRRDVDYGKRMAALEYLTGNSEASHDLSHLWANRYDASIKLWLVYTLLKERKTHAALFAEGHYYPLKIKGKYKQHVLAFARRLKSDWYVVAVPLNIAVIANEQQLDSLSIDWGNTRIVLPGDAPDEWENVLNKSKGKQGKGILIRDLFDPIPLALLKLKAKVSHRGSGILMHITSLPSDFGVGDLGPDAYRFADFLARSKQKYWQLLPLNQTNAGVGYSPYSSTSSIAGNTLLISPELLAEEGWLEEEDYKPFLLPRKSEADFIEAEKIKSKLQDRAYHAFKAATSDAAANEFREFCYREAYWLNDYSLYEVLKQAHQGQPWYQWKEEYKFRNEEQLRAFDESHKEEITYVKWLQYVFFRQWHRLKAYCNSLGIKMFGDLPFYVSYDSADVWSHREIFSLDDTGAMKGVAGVPPDYFNSDGQLWGMPVFDWEKLKKRNYNWWIQRLRKNIELFDLVRLDHFRAFADYWEVPANETTAKKGQWKLGPGTHFFEVVKKELGSLPFIAEDLGEISDIVIKLRDEFNLPGMKILQFAFGDDMPHSHFIPHNYTCNFVAYTGTHDNNTSMGWFRQDTGKNEKKNLVAYTGVKVKEKNVHEVLGRMAYSSVADIVILPIQDVLGLDESARMNMPASVKGNWLWRLWPDQLTKEYEKKLRKWVRSYNRE